MHEKSFKIETIHEVNSSIFRLFYTSNKYSIVELVSQTLNFHISSLACLARRFLRRQKISLSPCSREITTGHPYKQCVCLCSSCKEMYGKLKSLNIVNSLTSSNDYVNAQNKRQSLTYLSCCVVSFMRLKIANFTWEKILGKNLRGRKCRAYEIIS